MRARVHPWILAVVLLLLCALVLGVSEWRSLWRYDASGLLQTLPLNGAVKVYVDFEKLRASGMLDEIAGKRAAEDADYRTFADQIGFDYRTDLDALAMSFVNGGAYAAAKGHFNWTKMDGYARSQQGRCADEICIVPASQPNRTISFYPLSGRVMALTVSDAPAGVRMISAGQSRGFSVPSALVWISAPGSAFKNPPAILPGTKSFLTPLADSREVSFDIQPQDFGGNGALEIRLDVTSNSAEAATQLAGDLTSTTFELRHMLSLQKLTPPKSSLTSLLVAGHFEAHGSKVTGTWPLDPAVIQALISGQVN